jgi:hypothetical protein
MPMSTLLATVPPLAAASPAPALTNRELLAIWERGQGQEPVARALAILAVAYPAEEADALAALPLGRRDARLLAVRAATFGPRLPCLAPCPACSEAVEIALDVASLETAWEGVLDAWEREYRVASDGWEIVFRLPDSRDLAAAIATGEETAARDHLVARCVQSARRRGREWPASALDEAPISVLAAAIAERDPGAEIELHIACPSCGAVWRPLFDIGAFLWLEIEAQARRLLHEVAALARGFGWREADILALSATRRHAYLELLS